MRSFAVLLIALAAFAGTGDAALGGTYTSEWGETIHMCPDLFVSYIGTSYTGVAELQWVEANSRYEGQFVSSNGIGNVWWAENADNATILEGGWSFSNGVFGGEGSGSWNGERTDTSTTACDNLVISDIADAYTAEERTFHICYPDWDLGFTANVDRSIVQGEWVGSNDKGPANGVFFMVWSPTEQKYVGRFQSVLGGGGLEMTLDPEAAAHSLSYTVDTTGHQFSASSGDWQLSRVVGETFDENVCMQMLPTLSVSLGGDFLTDFDEAVKLCTPGFTRDTLGVTLQGEYQAEGYNGLTYGVYSFIAQEYAGYFESQNGVGLFWWSEKPSSNDIVGRWGFVSGDFEGLSTGDWNATSTDTAVTDAVCNDFRQIATLEGTYDSNFSEEVKICHPDSSGTVGVLQAQYVHNNYNGLSWLIYRPSEAVFKGWWESQNGLGSVVWSADGDTGNVDGTWNLIYGLSDGGDWTLAAKDSAGDEESVCSALFRDLPDISGEYLSEFGETVGLCSSLDLLRPLTGEYHADQEGNTGYNGITMMMWVPTEGQYRGSYVSQNGFGDVTWKQIADSDNLEGTWAFDDGSFEGGSSGSWGLTKDGATLESFDAFCGDTRKTFRDTPSLVGQWTATTETLNLCSPRKGYSQGNATLTDSAAVAFAVASVYQYTTATHRFYYDGSDGGIGSFTQDANKNLAGVLTSTQWDLSFASDTAEGVDCTSLITVALTSTPATSSSITTPSTTSQGMTSPSLFMCVFVAAVFALI